MSDALLAALAPLLARASSYLEAHPELKSEVAAAARAVAAWAEPQPTASPVEPAVVPEVPPPPLVVELAPAPRESVLDQLILPVPISARTSVVLPSAPMATPPPAGDHTREFVPLPLTTVAARCRVKMAAAKLMSRKSSGATDTAAEEDALRTQAEAIPDCGLWMLDPHGYPKSKAVWEDLAGGFQVTAAAADLLRAWGASGPDMAAGQEVLTHAAEAQSMLLYAVADVGWVSRDHEQVQMFVHIRELGKLHQIYVPRFLRREDPADPVNWPNLAERLKLLTAKFKPVAGVNGTNGVAGDPTKVRQKALGNLKFKLRKLADDPAAQADEWPRVVELLDQAVTAGVPPSNLELREMLLPVYDAVPEDLPATPGVERVFRAIELYRDSQTAAVPEEADDQPHVSAEVQRARELLTGKELVLIGGQRRPHHVAALRRTLALADVRWLSTPEHTSFTFFEPDIARPDVAVVVLAIRWSNHDYAEVQRYCEKYGKPLVRLRAGYNPNQVAHQVLTQAGERLAALATAAASDGFSAGL
jgi:hypothetical protein